MSRRTPVKIGRLLRVDGGDGQLHRQLRAVRSHAVISMTLPSSGPSPVARYRASPAGVRVDGARRDDQIGQRAANRLRFRVAKGSLRGGVELDDDVRRRPS